MLNDTKSHSSTRFTETITAWHRASGNVIARMSQWQYSSWNRYTLLCIIGTRWMSFEAGVQL